MNNSNKLTATIAITLLAQLANPAQAMRGDSERTELQGALKQCHSALRVRYDNPDQHRIYQRPTTSIKRQDVTFWINSTTVQDGKKMQLKSRCVTGIDGNIISLRVASGQWHPQTPKQL